MNNKYDESNIFDRLVIKHYELKDKKHISNGKAYSNYDVLVGMQIVLFVVTTIFLGFGVSSLFLILLIFTWLLNNVEFTKRED